MKADERRLLGEVVLGWADDELVIGHRDSEWTGHAPILEEDIALTNLALDELGHAQLLYQVAAALFGEDETSYPDKVVYSREAPQWRNLRLVELPIGDWAFTIVRRYLHDSIERHRWGALADSSFKPLQATAAKIASEEPYHMRFAESRLRRLALGTQESKQRAQRALDQLWPLASQAFQPPPGFERLEQTGLMASMSELETAWRGEAVQLLEELEMMLPEQVDHLPDRTEHSEHLVSLLDELQRVARAYPGAPW